MNKKPYFKYFMFMVGGIIVLLIILKFAGVFSKNAIAVTTEKAELHSITEVVIATGKVQPEQEVLISPEVWGEIISLPVKEGQIVEKNSLLVKIQPDLYQASLNKAKASLENMQAQVRSSEANYKQSKARTQSTAVLLERSKELLKGKVISTQDYEKTELDFLLAQQQETAALEQLSALRYSVKSAEASLKEAGDNLARTAILSPIDGTVSSLDVEEGERVVGTQQMQGTQIMKIADLRHMEVLVEINEIDITRISLEDKVIIEIDAFGRRKFDGIVTEISSSAKTTTVANTNATANFDIKVRILESSYADLITPEMKNRTPFLPGMSATVEVITDIRKNVVAVPVLAITTLDKQATESNEEEFKEIVYLYQNGKAVMREVKTGIQDDFFIEIVDGINKDDEVITGPYEAISTLLKDGLTVDKRLNIKKEG